MPASGRKMSASRPSAQSVARPSVFRRFRKFRGLNFLASNPPDLVQSGGLLAMHELSLMTNAMGQVLEIARRNEASRIHRIRLRVGALSGVVPEALEFAFETLKRGTPAENGALEIERVPATFHCDGCGKDFALHEIAFDCPECGGPLALASGGRELELADMEIS